ncbi:hypothetical protein [Halorussus pelagicus]|uniref:hypothetical protein n=1 Tax=Halorussus pelagicus TaxID=2505977 RepID=UPI000FFB32FF|nr:hypothetical protein [Halorussus pelagicus]
MTPIRGAERGRFRRARPRDAGVEATAALVRVSTPEGSRLTAIRGGNRGAAVTLVADRPLRIVSGEGNLRLDGGRERRLRADDTVTFVHGGDRWLER